MVRHLSVNWVSIVEDAEMFSPNQFRENFPNCIKSRATYTVGLRSIRLQYFEERLRSFLKMSK